MCAAVAGIFCVVELLVFVTELRAKRLFRRRRRSLELPHEQKSVTGPRGVRLAGK
jgi:hypothetical protein